MLTATIGKDVYQVQGERIAARQAAFEAEVVGGLSKPGRRACRDIAGILGEFGGAAARLAAARTALETAICEAKQDKDIAIAALKELGRTYRELGVGHQRGSTVGDSHAAEVGAAEHRVRAADALLRRLSGLHADTGGVLKSLGVARAIQGGAAALGG